MAIYDFELVTNETQTRVALSGWLLGWSDDVQHRLNEHAVLNRSGVIHQSQGQGPRRFLFRLLERAPSASERYADTEALLAREPFCTLIHPRFNRVPVAFVSLKASDDMEVRTNGMTAELALCETGLRELKADSASSAARSAAASSSELVLMTVQIPTLAGLAREVAAQASAFLVLTEAATSQFDLAQGKAAAALAVDSLIRAAGVAVRRFPIVVLARLIAAQLESAYKLSGAQLPPIIPKIVPQRMSLARFARSLYGGGAKALEAEISRINRIPAPYSISQGTVLQVPDPARVQLTPGGAPTAAVAETDQRGGSWALRDSPTTRGRLTWLWGADGNLVVDEAATYPVLMAIVAHKGAYRWDRFYGTRLHKATRERSTTGSQLAAYARDGGAQVEAAGIATGVTPRVDRLASGRWRLAVRWTAAGRTRTREVGL